MNRFILLATVAVTLTGASVAQASDPVGIYALVDKVVFEPNDSAPERIQVWGTFLFAKKGTRDDYEAPARGYLYFSLPKGKEDTARKEWNDLKKVAGSMQCVAFASRYESQGKLRKATDKAENADAYPLGFGMQKIEDRSSHAKTLKDDKAKQK